MCCLRYYATAYRGDAGVAIKTNFKLLQEFRNIIIFEWILFYFESCYVFNAKITVLSTF
jgi:hypothetical protein